MMHLDAHTAEWLEGQSLHDRSHHTLSTYELPIIEEPGRPPYAEDYERLSYTHNFTGRRVEYTRPRYHGEVSPEHLAEIRAAWDAKVAAAPRRVRDCRTGSHINLATRRRTAVIVAEWKQLAKDPMAVAWPGRAEYNHAIEVAMGDHPSE